MPSVRKYSVPRYRRDTSFLNSMTEDEIIDMLRVDRKGISEIASLIESHPLISRKTKAGLSAENQLVLALRYFATGNTIHSIQNTFGLNVAYGTAYQAVRNGPKRQVR